MSSFSTETFGPTLLRGTEEVSSGEALANCDAIVSVTLYSPTNKTIFFRKTKLLNCIT